jgi:ribonuclease HI
MPTDPQLAARLLDMISSLESGRSLGEALDDAGVTRDEASALFNSMKAKLRRDAAKTLAPAPRRKAGPDADTSVVVAYADGGSRGNPGRAACASILYDATDAELLRRYRLLGRATNNAAEYEGVLLALGLAAELGARTVRLRIDSELVVRQIQGSYKVKNADLKPLHARVIALTGRFDRFSVEHVRRKDNAEADALVNAALDGKAEEGENAT